MKRKMLAKRDKKKKEKKDLLFNLQQSYKWEVVTAVPNCSVTQEKMINKRDHQR